ncbi:hypothetical protein D9M69_588210 [compost metagenome]
MLGQRAGDLFTDLWRCQTPDIDVPHNRIANIAIHIDGVEPRQRWLTINCDLQNIIGADEIGLSLCQDPIGRPHSDKSRQQCCFKTGTQPEVIKSVNHLIASRLILHFVSPGLIAPRNCRSQKPAGFSDARTKVCNSNIDPVAIGC